MDLFYVSRSWLPRVREFKVHEWSWKRSGSDHMPVSLGLDLGCAPKIVDGNT
jgi:endonuclease/exonuclease/phosphatase family metal-dependent hydrolase